MKETPSYFQEKELRQVVMISGNRQSLLLAFSSALILALPLTTCYSGELDDSLLVYAAIIQMPTWRGNGIYLGKGFFVTAAHVVGRAWLTKPKVIIGDKAYPTRVVKEGSFEGTDLTLMSIEERLLPMRLSLRRNSLCREPPWPGEQVVTVAPEGVVRTHIISPERLPLGVRKFNTVIADVARTGNSGSGVFDAEHLCLLGIMSRKISITRTRRDTGKTETVEIAKYFIPASEINSFLPSDLPNQ